MTWYTYLYKLKNLKKDVRMNKAMNEIIFVHGFFMPEF
jgi:hypothetical protein